ncbi:bacitracin ABC transporter ATP-binding protein [Paenibacillus sp. Root52]|uniref:Bacitracin transport system ATP-binding protein n=1 Tax=Paenibacillus amylolyticus TaxID=1451 RepID=A0AAP5H6L8_PAEAM|nr:MULTISPECIES: ABC transporter ATP-binding protein [Paenibacillus]KQY84362.1 bacitracin ABC transporter ATP-binding protein [Paenibacillus sp. Root52]MDR6726767.1 bacitracin transport system ATP-binding protein [Paenibacillus amylolyticus]
MDHTAIRITNLTKKYNEQTAVNQVKIEVKQGRIYGLLGRNGAGKTTIMKMMMGLVKPDSGDIEILGERIGGSSKERKRLYSRIGAIIETPGFYPNLTGTENMEIFAKLRGTVSRNAVKEALDIVGLPYKDKKLFANYSLGMKQRLGIANAIMHDPELLILDEPTNGLDPIGIAEMRDLIKEMSSITGKTIFISSHILSEISLLADDIGIIHNGILLTESSYAELEKNNTKYFLLKVSSSAQAARVLEQKLGQLHYSVDDDHTIRLFDTQTDIAQVNKALMLSDIDVSASQLCNDTLEDYFRKITGGEGIA